MEFGLLKFHTYALAGRTFLGKIIANGTLLTPSAFDRNLSIT